MYSPPEPGRGVDAADVADEAAAGRISATQKADRGDLLVPTGGGARIKPIDLSDHEAVAREVARSWRTAMRSRG
jgi:hypothetical protein